MTGKKTMKTKVLIVDDDVAITQQLFWTLCDEFEVMTANSLSSAIRRATIYEPDIAILDLHLPATLDAPDTSLRILDYVKSHLPGSKPTPSSTSRSTWSDCSRPSGARRSRRGSRPEGRRPLIRLPPQHAVAA